MHVTCTHCEASYDVDLPESALKSGRKRLKFRCGVCGQRFLIDRAPEPVSAIPERNAAAGAAAAAPAPADGAAPSIRSSATDTSSMRLRQDGNVYELSDVATLQRWIVERRVSPHDQICFDGETWESVRSRPDLKVFFQLVSQVEQAESISNDPKSGENLSREDTEEAPWRDEVQAASARVSFDEQARDDAFADLREPEEGSGEWDPMDPPSPRLRTDHGFNPSAMSGAMPQEEEPTLSRDIPGVDERSELGPEPKTIALADPLVSMDDTEERDPFFAGPTETDGVTESVPMVDSGSFSRTLDSVPEPDLDPDPYFRAPRTDDFLEEDDGPDLPPVESSVEPAENEFISENRSLDLGTGGGDDTLFSVTEDAFMDDDDFWEKEQAQAAKVRKIGLVMIALIAVGVLVWQVSGDDEETDASTSTSEPASEEHASSAESASGEGGVSEQGQEGEGAKNSDGNDSTTGIETVDPEIPSAEEVATRNDEASDEEADLKAAEAKERARQEAREEKAREEKAREEKAREEKEEGWEGGVDVGKYVDQGWRFMDKGDAKTAADRFGQALAKNPRSADAQFGVAYASEELGKKDKAYNHYCQTLKYAGKDSDNYREAKGRLDAMGRTCK